LRIKGGKYEVQESIMVVDVSSVINTFNYITAYESIVVNDKSLTVHYIDVGQGDAILIQSDNKTMLIDGGDRYNWVADKLTAYLNK